MVDQSVGSMPSRSKTGGADSGVMPRFPATVLRANQSRISRCSASTIATLTETKHYVGDRVRYGKQIAIQLRVCGR